MNMQVSGTARLGADPELRFTPSGKAVCELRLSFSNSFKKRGDDNYTYSPPIWVGLTLWDTMAENAAAMLRKGDECVVAGVLELEEYEKRDGDKATKLIIKNGEVAPSIRRDLKFTRTDGRGEEMARPSNGNGQYGGQAQRQRSDNRQPAGAGARSAPPAAGAPAFPDDPPF
jgi:single-strand DNA-binding protein